MTKSALAECRKSVPCLCNCKGRFILTMERVSIYIDGANFSYGIRSIKMSYTDFKFDFGKYAEEMTRNKKLIQVYYYNASLKYEINPELFKEQQKFFNRLKKLENFKLILCKRQRINNKDGTYNFRIKGDDLHLALDMLKDAYENKYDRAILISGDGDFKPLANYVKKLGKKVENHYFKGNISMDLLNECNNNVLIDKKVVNRFFYREQQRNLDSSFNDKNTLIKKR